MHDSSVHEHSVLYQMQAYLPAPAYERENEENHDDRQNRICTQVSRAVYYLDTCFFPERIKSQRIYLSVDNFCIFLYLLSYTVYLVIALLFSGTAQPDAEVFCEKCIYRSKLYAVIFDEFYLFLYICISVFQYFLSSSVKEILIIQIFTAFNGSLLSFFAGIGIELCKSSGFVWHDPQSFC